MTPPRVIESGLLTVGVDASPPPPMQVGDPATPEFDGYEVELLRAIAQRIGLAVRFRSALWSDMLLDLEEGRLDVVCTAATVTADRRSRFLVGRPYLDLDLVAVTRQATPIAGLVDLRAKTFAVRRATTAEEYLHRELQPAEVICTEFNDEAYRNLEAGAVDALIDDAPIAAWFVAGRPSLRILAHLPDTKSQYAMMFARDNGELAGVMDDVLADLSKDGTVGGLQARWFGDSVGEAPSGIGNQ